MEIIQFFAMAYIILAIVVVGGALYIWFGDVRAERRRNRK